MNDWVNQYTIFTKLAKFFVDFQLGIFTEKNGPSIRYNTLGTERKTSYESFGKKDILARQIRKLSCIFCLKNNLKFFID